MDILNNDIKIYFRLT